MLQSGCVWDFGAAVGQSPRMRMTCLMTVLLFSSLSFGGEPVCVTIAEGTKARLCTSRLGQVVTQAYFDDGEPGVTTQYGCQTFMMRTLDNPKAKWSAWYPASELAVAYIKSICK